MDINLPLLLMVAVAVTGLFWLLDLAIWAKPRKKAMAEVEARFAAMPADEKKDDAAYLAASAAAKKEPILVEYSKSFFPVLALVFVLRSFLIEPFQIPSESMVPTLEVGDFIAVNKFTYGIRMPVFRTKLLEISQPERGDVVVFFPPHEDRYFIKRLIGLPGDTVEYSNHTLFINGVKVPDELLEFDQRKYRPSECFGRYAIVEETLSGDPYLTRKCAQPGRLSREGKWQVPPGHYFMMGDNRDNSQDSRAWPSPFVPDKNIVGKAFAIWMHWGEGLPSFDRAGAID